MTRAVILAAGIGSRLAAATNGKPKCLVPINGQPILLHKIRRLKEVGISDIIVVAGHEADQVKEVLPTDVTFVINRRYAETNSIVSLACAAPYLRGDDFLMMNVDVLYSTGLLKRMLWHPAPNACLVDVDRPYSPEEYRIGVNRDGQITQYVKGAPEYDTIGESAQLLKVGRADSDAFLSRVEQIAHTSGANGFPLQAYPVLQQGMGLFPVFTACLPWWEIDKPDDLRKCEESYASELARVRPTVAKPKPLMVRQLFERTLRFVQHREVPWRLRQTPIMLHALSHHPVRALRWYPRLWNQTLSSDGYRLQVYGTALLKQILQVAKTLDLIPMAGWGTLLGLIRDKNLIVGDHDIDLAIHERDAAKLPQLKAAMLNLGFSIRLDNAIKLSLYSAKAKGLFIDIDVIRDEGAWYSIVNNTAETHREFHYRFSRKVFDGLPGIVRVASGVEIAIPPDALQFLREVYGQWETPSDKVDFRCGPLNVHVEHTGLR